MATDKILAMGKTVAAHHPSILARRFNTTHDRSSHALPV
jgi:hypothetical protein